ncbi:cobalamin (vitamin B12) biosynthesis CbiX protein [Desulfofarcimen acetoxidans DSM 771]|jgi:sirohydrochlorin ferrochelatase|uniref:Cobalamin (Vitamin B12) biosynthesis CbiX protein n=1 Tax=Desulfofarcimen acetoxidans (strain ATCC 49208 / DSM 771 / KCTC 5769 / VKM B-1644 / 5575) TaxID=485916 RepID=C8VWS5_DESAS|nr:CbiX/SirB N-terminal domain-containing protein [Desulfofarcimen acetoxidans]ACV64439.1 cobalamin (vitamin B12) biosynthesis CbiX protein [Desulfofarcimen acetoxidans DSM 771]
MKKAVVMLGHGSRAVVGEANDIIIEIAQQVKDVLQQDIFEVAYMNPKSGRQNLGEAIDKVMAQGVEKIIIAPLFITNGMHIRYDIPEEIEEAKKKYPNVEIVFARIIGADPVLAKLMADRVTEVL